MRKMIVFCSIVMATFFCHQQPLVAQTLPTPAEVFQEAVDVALKIDNVYYFLIVQTIHAQRDSKDVKGIHTTVAKALPRIRAIPKPEDRYAELEALASAIHKAGLEELAAPLFEEAVQTAREILSPSQRVNELITLSAFRSLKQNKTETIEPLFNEAKGYAFSLDNAEQKSHALAVIAARELQFCGIHRWSRISTNTSDVPPVVLPRDMERILPYLNRALETIQAIPTASVRDKEYVSVVDRYVRMGEYAQALEIIRRMKTARLYYDTGNSFDGVLIALARGLTQLDNINEYESLVDELIDISDKSDALLSDWERGYIHIKRGKVEYAQLIVSLLARLGRFDEAMQLGKSFPVIDRDYGRLSRQQSGIDEANYQIALAHGKAGRDDEAVQYLNRMENDYWRNEGFWQLANAQAKKGEYEKAIENVMQIDENQWAKNMFEHLGEYMRHETLCFPVGCHHPV